MKSVISPRTKTVTSLGTKVTSRSLEQTHMSYEFLTKNFQRAAVLQMYLSQDERKPIVYLDDKHYGATSFFLSNGVPRKHLVPINFSQTEASEITEKTGIKCVVRCIDDYVFDMTDDSCSVVWLDYMCRTFSDKVIQQCLAVAPHVSVTLSTRGRQRSDIVADVRRVAKKYGSLLESPVFYKGKSDVENMVRFAITRRTVEPLPRSKTPKVRTTKDVLPPPTSLSVGDKVYVDWKRNVWLTGVVASVNGKRERVTVTFDCDGTTKEVAMSRVRRNADVPSETRLNTMIGKTIRMPTSLWNGSKMAGYDNVKTMGKRFMFRVTKRYAGKNRFGVSAISKVSNRPMTPMEKFTLSYEQIACFL